MNLKKIKQQLNSFFDLASDTQSEKQDKLLDIIDSLKKKKAKLKKEIKKQGFKKANCNQSIELCKEFKVVSKLIKKAKKRFHNSQDQA